MSNVDIKKERIVKDVTKVIIFSTIVIIFSMLLVGAVSYVLTEKQIVKKLREQDLQYIAKSTTTRVDDRIIRAKEAAHILTDNLTIQQWVKDGEPNNELKRPSLQMIKDISEKYDYDNTFIVSAITNNYWSETGKVIQQMSKQNPDDEWFFNTLASKQRISVIVDHNEQRKDTFVFVNALMGDIDHPIAIVGVGLSLKDMSKDFEKYKYGENSDLWLVDQAGSIVLSNKFENTGQPISTILPSDVAGKLIVESKVLEYTDHNGEQYDLISYPLTATDLTLVFQIKRSETVGFFLSQLKLNTFMAIVVCLIAISLLFFYISRKITNPYKLSLELNERLEQIVAERTEELEEQTNKIIDSIDYSKRLQQALFPTNEQLKEIVENFFLVWRPRDIVGGDFYWAKKVKNGSFIALGDCTGHGVPGAFMSVLVITLLNQFIHDDCNDEPDIILSKLNQEIKSILNQEENSGATDDGLDIGLCFIRDNEMVYSGAKIQLFVMDENQITTYEGDRRSIGYRKTPMSYAFTKHVIPKLTNSSFIMTTDGLIDQNGGEKGNTFGRKKFKEMIFSFKHKPLHEQKLFVEQYLEEYMGQELQRDDITVLGFKIE